MSFEQGMAGPVDFCHHRKPAYTDLNAGYNNEITQATPGQSITIELKAALNQNWDKVDKGWVEISKGTKPEKAEVTETGPNTGIFTAEYIVPKTGQGSKLSVSYGYLGFEKKAELTITR